MLTSYISILHSICVLSNRHFPILQNNTIISKTKVNLFHQTNLSYYVALFIVRVEFCLISSWKCVMNELKIMFYVLCCCCWKEIQKKGIFEDFLFLFFSFTMLGVHCFKPNIIRQYHIFKETKLYLLKHFVIAKILYHLHCG